MGEINVSRCRDKEHYKNEDAIKIKQYDSVEFICRYRDINGYPLPLTGVQIHAQIINKYQNQLLDTLSVNVTDVENGEFVMRTTVDELPKGKHDIDILFVKNGKSVSSETFVIEVERAITRRPPPMEVPVETIPSDAELPIINDASDNSGSVIGETNEL